MSTTNLTLSLVIPVFNERRTLAELLARVSCALPQISKEIVVVDDRSTDGTREWLQATIPADGIAAAGFIAGPDDSLSSRNEPSYATTRITAHYHERNGGKGAAVRTGLALATGGVVAIQDADLEYDPNDLLPMYELIVHRRVADAVIGSRFYGNPHRSLFFHHYLANRFISLLFNVLFNQTLTDVECCYKVMSAETVRSLSLSASDFGIEIEIAAGLARQRSLRIYEIGISYFGRSYDEGKKISWRDGVKALWYLVKYRLSVPRRSR